MTLRIPINNFGTPIYSSTEGGLSKIAADRAYINVDGGDQMKGNLEMSGYKISNLKTPVENQDATNKLYVDELYLSLTEKIDELKQAANQIRSLTQNFATKNELIRKTEEIKSSTQNFITKNELTVHKFLIRASQVELVKTGVSVEKLIVQSVWFKTTDRGYWVNAISHDDLYDKTMYTIRLEGDRLYFWCSKLHPSFTGDCCIILLNI